MAEYDETATELAKDHALPALSRMMLLLASRVALVTPGALEQPICRDPQILPRTVTSGLYA